MSLISQLPKLSSFNLQDDKYHSGNWDKFHSNAPIGRNRIRSLEEFQLSSYNCKHAELIIPWFSACGVKRFVASHFDFKTKTDPSISCLSNVFPQLDHLKIDSVSYLLFNIVLGYSILIAPLY